MARAWQASLTVLLAGLLVTASVSATEAKATGNKAGTAAPAKSAPSKDSGDAHREIEAGIASLQAGKIDAAVEQLTAGMAMGRLPGPQMARALYYRGLAHRKQGKPALAIADLTNALWLKDGLDAAERADAVKNRSAAYREAGLPDQADPDAIKAAAVPGGKPVETARAAPSRDVATSPLPAPDKPADPPPQSTGGSTDFAGFFANLFAPASASSPEAPLRPTPTRTAAVAGVVWGGQTEVRRADDPEPPAKPLVTGSTTPTNMGATPVTFIPATANPSAVQLVSIRATTTIHPIPATPIPATAVPGESFRLQVAALRSRDEAQALALQLRQQHGRELEGRETDVEEFVIGSMGTLYRVRLGPFASDDDPRALCIKLRRNGLDCHVVSQ